MKISFLLFLSLLLFSQCKKKHEAGDSDLKDTAFDYSGKYLSQVRIPIGGVGTGNLLIGGRGDIAFMEMFNRPNRVRQPYKTFFSLWVKRGDAPPVAKVLERELLPPYGQSTHQYVSGLPRFQEAVLTNTYPLPHWEFRDEDIPLDIELEAFNPFVPTSLQKSSYPIVAFKWKISNPGKLSVAGSIALNIENPIESDCLVNTYYEANKIHGLHFKSMGNTKLNFRGGMIVGTDAREVKVQTHWFPGRWRDDAHVLWDDFSDDGDIEVVTEPWYSAYKPVSYNETSDRNGTVLVPFELKPGEVLEIPFYMAWYFPTRVFTKNETFWIEEASEKAFSNFYSNLFQHETHVLDEFLTNQQELYALTKAFSDALHGSTYPPYVIEALSTQAATLKSNLLQITATGDVHGFEGVGQDGWCCPGTCTHVWNYEQTLASLFPEQERKMRSIEFLHDTFQNGFQTHRSVLPLGDYWFNGPAAADGQMGSIIRVFREWKLSGDSDWLKSLWPKVKKALEFAWYGPGEIQDVALQFQASQTPWDPNKTGVMTGRQHNTYDISFYGPNSMTTSLYLGALMACAEMAEAMEEPEKSKEYMEVYDRGAAYMADELWNGEYFIQLVVKDPQADDSEDYELSPADVEGQVIPKYQYGDGCLSDQLLGQYLAHISGLGFILDREMVDDAIYAVYEHNFINELRDFANVQRVYGLNDESGVVLCTWPQENRPSLPFVYADEIWSGVEYQVAASLIYSGFIDEGLEVIKAVQDRHDGYKRNPFEHDESGVHYARAMASWSALLALSGFEYDGVKKSMAFSPKINPGNFSTFWSCNSGWGTFTVKDKKASLEVLFGKLELQEFSIGSGHRIKKTDIGADISYEGDKSTCVFDEILQLEQNEEWSCILH